MLFIVARDQPDLLASLEREFASEREVQVLFDRRYGERRQQPLRVVEDRRRLDRRMRPQVDAHLQAIGWVVVHTERAPA